jgi:hypothetical protein
MNIVHIFTMPVNRQLSWFSGRRGGRVEQVEFGFAEAGGVEAMLDGVEVAGLAAAAALGGGGVARGWLGDHRSPLQ